MNPNQRDLERSCARARIAQHRGEPLQGPVRTRVPPPCAGIDPRCSGCKPLHLAVVDAPA